MAKKIMSRSVWALGMCVALALIASTFAAKNALSCKAVVKKLMPCKPFLRGGSANVTGACCDAARGLTKLAGSASGSERRAIYRCLKRASMAMRIKPSKAMHVAKLCKILPPLPSFKAS
ncbi:hypothetical protein U1Q18_010983 [Sarracenia purpurea var. burkii]